MVRWVRSGRGTLYDSFTPLLHLQSLYTTIQCRNCDLYSCSFAPTTHLREAVRKAVEERDKLIKSSTSEVRNLGLDSAVSGLKKAKAPPLGSIWKSSLRRMDIERRPRTVVADVLVDVESTLIHTFVDIRVLSMNSTGSNHPSTTPRKTSKQANRARCLHNPITLTLAGWSSLKCSREGSSCPFFPSPLGV